MSYTHSTAVSERYTSPGNYRTSRGSLLYPEKKTRKNLIAHSPELGPPFERSQAKHVPLRARLSGPTAWSFVPERPADGPGRWRWHEEADSKVATGLLQATEVDGMRAGRRHAKWWVTAVAATCRTDATSMVLSGCFARAR